MIMAFRPSETRRHGRNLHTPNAEQDDIGEKDHTEEVGIPVASKHDGHADEKKEHHLHGTQYATLILGSHGGHAGLA